MCAPFKVLCHSLLSQLCVRPVEKDNKVRNGLGFTFNPDPKRGNGYLWTYPINAACSLVVCDLEYHKEFVYKYSNPELILISMDLSKAYSNDLKNNAEEPLHIVGQYVERGEEEITIAKGSKMKNITILMQPAFFSELIPDFFDRDADEIIDAICALDGNTSIPEAERLMLEMAEVVPHFRTASMRYEAKLFDLLATIFEWHFVKKTSYSSEEGVSEVDREILQNLHHFLEQNFTSQLELEKLSQMCGMSRSKLT